MIVEEYFRIPNNFFQDCLELFEGFEGTIYTYLFLKDFRGLLSEF